ncbi:fluoroquinolone transport system permease protein [Gracilibacillus ureilyticus]|uniref:Fluoroquinolone transport system permease protein n=1 Tax=Gracilibacillus ureilyticus TaxID=531814 RepID=A0A1H9U9G5_9BACI|nr:ABC transporter permease [Gracilibacillus ureilyticus]SES05868.1 fluoroquinolone transport system permease protein [Gracilibacillus ureilyticus]
MRKLELFKFDVQFQIRHGFYPAYALVSLLYIGLLSILPAPYVEQASILIIFTDPSVLGFFFVGGLVLLERDQSTFSTLFVSPIRIHEYLFSKVISLTTLSCLSSSIIFITVHESHLNYFPFIIAVMLCSIFFTLLGILLAVRVDSVNMFLYMSPALVIVFYLPLLDFFNLIDSFLVYLLPTKAVLLLLEGSFNTLSLWDYFYAIAVLTPWISIAYMLTLHEFQRFLRTKCF